MEKGREGRKESGGRKQPDEAEHVVAQAEHMVVDPSRNRASNQKPPAVSKSVSTIRSTVEIGGIAG